MGHWENVERFEIAAKGLANYQERVNERKDPGDRMWNLGMQWSDVYAGTRLYEKNSGLVQKVGNCNQAIADTCRSCGIPTIDSLFYDAGGKPPKTGDRDDPAKVRDWYKTLTIGEFNKHISAVIGALRDKAEEGRGKENSNAEI